MSTLVLTSRAVTIRRRQSDERERWIAAYRQTWPMAGRWAASGAVQHSVETQDRVFRMTEQLISRGVLATRTAAFEALIAADRAVPRDASDACVVAAGARIQAAHESPVPGAGFAPPEWRRASGRPVRETSEARLTSRSSSTAATPPPLPGPSSRWSSGSKPSRTARLPTTEPNQARSPSASPSQRNRRKGLASDDSPNRRPGIRSFFVSGRSPQPDLSTYAQALAARH